MRTVALAELVHASAVHELSRRGLGSRTLPAVTVSRPARAVHGHYTTNFALVSARRLGLPSRGFAEWLAGALGSAPGIRAATVAGPGFVNLWLSPAAHWDGVRAALARGERDGGRWEYPDPGAVRTREGALVSMPELVAAVGDGTARFAVARAGGAARARTVVLDHPLAELRRQDERNPCYRVRYARSRAAATVRVASELGVGFRLGCEVDGEVMATVMRTVGEFPALAVSRDPRGLARYLERLAGDFLVFSCRRGVLPTACACPDERAAGRVAVCAAVGRVLAGGLGLLGVDAPERM